MQEVAARLARALRADAHLEHVASRVGERVRLIPVGDVTHIVARNRGTFAMAGGTEHMLDASLTDLERRLDPSKFLRIHRATLLNMAWVAELHALMGGRLIVRLRGAYPGDLEVSRDRVRALKARLGLP